MTSPSLGTFKTWLGTALSNPVINVSMPRPLPTRVIPSSYIPSSWPETAPFAFNLSGIFLPALKKFLSKYGNDNHLHVDRNFSVLDCKRITNLGRKTPSRLLTGCEVPLQRCGAGGSSASAGERWLPLCFSCCPRVCSVLCYFHSNFFFSSRE